MAASGLVPWNRCKMRHHSSQLHTQFCAQLGCKLTDTPTDTIHINTCVVSHGHCCHYILKIVKYQETPRSPVFTTGISSVLVRRIIWSPLRKIPCSSLLSWRNIRSSVRYACKLTKNLILIIQYAYILRAWLLLDQLFHTDILSHCMMTVQMILCDIQNGAYPWSKFPDSLKLEAAVSVNCNVVLSFISSALEYEYRYFLQKQTLLHPS